MKRKLVSRSEMYIGSFNESSGLAHSMTREPSMVDDFYFEESQPHDDNLPSVSVTDPIYMLFNQERLSQLGSLAATEFLNSLSNGTDSLAELRKSCSDDDLMMMMKSRHLQSPCEILAWCRYMQSNVDRFNSEYARLLAEQQAQETAEIERNVELNTN